MTPASSHLIKQKYHKNLMTILDVRKIDHLNIKTKMLDIEAHVLIGWYSLASQSERVSTRCFYVKVVYLSYGEYRFNTGNETVLTFCCHNSRIINMWHFDLNRRSP